VGKTFGQRAACAVLIVGGLIAASCTSDATKVATTGKPSADTVASTGPAKVPDTVAGTDSTDPAITDPATTDPSTTGPQTPDTTPPPAPGDDRAFKVMVIGDETSQISFTVAEAVPAVQGALANLPNVEVLHCDSAGDTNTALDCEREAVDAGVAIVIVSFGGVGSDQSVLTDAGIPTIGGSDAKAATSFSLSSGLASYAGLGVAAGEAKCTKIATLYLDGADFLANMVKTGAELSGATEVARAALAQNTPDIAPAVATLTSANPDCIFLNITPTQVVQAVTALAQSDTKAQLIGVGAVFPPEVVSELGDLVEGVITSEIALNPADESPIIDQIASDMAPFDPKAKVTTVGILSWASAKLIEDALPAIDGDVTAASLTTALQGLKDAPGGGAIHPFTPVPIDNPLFNRFYNPWGLLYKIIDGVPVRQTPDYFSLLDTLKVASF
jgi:ABC-type branched-subunit amino acid transport system substrate-binding protein